MSTLKYIALVICISNLIYVGNSYHFEKCMQSLKSKTKIVKTQSGPIIGECHIVPYNSSAGKMFESEVYSWLGIPYAEPPIENNRFSRPKQLKPWSNLKVTTIWPKKCIQSELGMDGNSTSEDCLYLNIFVRSDTFLNSYVESKPIMIWIDGVQNTYEPSTLVATSDVIVVSFNYRLGVFGFLSLENTEASGNAGFLDQHMAIKWVYENAKYFGGDNTKITLFGQDAGALSVGYHLFYPESWPYFRNGIMQSGLPIGSSKNIQI